MTRRAHARPLGLALGGGTARGYAHIGVLKVLERDGIRPDLITGTSIGAVFGALAAAGYAAEDVERLFGNLDARQILRMVRPRPSKSGMLDLHGFMNVLADLLPSGFDDLVTPFACVSTDLMTGSRVIHFEGDLLKAIRASISVPVAFEPVADDGRMLVDGGLVEPVPVPTARLLAAETVIGVTLNVVTPRSIARERRRRLDAKEPAGQGPILHPARRWEIWATATDVMMRQLAEAILSDADIVIAPKIEAFTQLAFLDAAPLIELGERAAEEKLPEIHRLLR